MDDRLRRRSRRRFVYTVLDLQVLRNLPDVCSSTGTAASASLIAQLLAGLRLPMPGSFFASATKAQLRCRDGLLAALDAASKALTLTGSTLRPISIWLSASLFRASTGGRQTLSARQALSWTRGVPNAFTLRVPSQRPQPDRANLSSSSAGAGDGTIDPQPFDSFVEAPAVFTASVREVSFWAVVPRRRRCRC